MKDFKLENHPKIGNGFKEPENYFNNLSETITARIKEDENKPRVISLFKRRKLWIPAVAAILVIALMIPVYNNLTKTAYEPDAASIENYINYGSDISQYELVNLLDSEDIENIDKDIQLDDTTIEDILTTNSNFETYINN